MCRYVFVVLKGRGDQTHNGGESIMALASTLTDHQRSLPAGYNEPYLRYWQVIELLVSVARALSRSRPPTRFPPFLYVPPSVLPSLYLSRHSSLPIYPHSLRFSVYQAVTYHAPSPCSFIHRPHHHLPFLPSHHGLQAERSVDYSHACLRFSFLEITSTTGKNISTGVPVYYIVFVSNTVWDPLLWVYYYSSREAYLSKRRA